MIGSPFGLFLFRGQFLSPVAALGITMRRRRRQYGTMYARLDFCHSLCFILLTHTRINYETKLDCLLFHTMRGQTCGLAGAQILGAQSGLTSRRNLQPAFRLSVTRTLITGKLVKRWRPFAEGLFPNATRFSQVQRQKDGINCLNKTSRQSLDKISGYELRRGFVSSGTSTA